MTIRFDMKKDKKEETMNPLFHWGGLDLQNRRNFSAFFGQTEASAKQARERATRERRSANIKNTTKHLYPYAHQDRKTTKNNLRIVNSLGGYDWNYNTLKMSESLKKKESGLRALFLFLITKCTHTNFSSYFSPRHRRRLQQTWFYVEATFSPKKWRLQVNICFYASETYKKVIYLNVNKSLQLFWCFKCVCGQVL